MKVAFFSAKPYEETVFKAAALSLEKALSVEKTESLPPISCLCFRQ